MSDQFVDPSVSTAKFDRQVTNFRSLQLEYQKKGWLLVEAVFPTMFVVVCAPQLDPPSVLCGVRFDYTNYDTEPPSVQLVNPFTRQPYTWATLPPAAHLPRAQPHQVVQLPGMPGPVEVAGPPSTLMQPDPDPNGIPFLCVAGTREYHHHPGHSGDPWELHRASGAGEAVRLLDVIYRYGVEPMKGYAANLEVKIGLVIPEPAP